MLPQKIINYQDHPFYPELRRRAFRIAKSMPFDMLSFRQVLDEELVEFQKVYDIHDLEYLASSISVWMFDNFMSWNKDYYDKRNLEIYKRRESGISAKDLAAEFALSVGTINLICRKIRQKN